MMHKTSDNKILRASGGFTLIELLIAISVFAVMSVMAYGGLSNVISNSGQSELALERLQQVQRAMLNVNRDLSQIVKRDIRDETGLIKSYFRAGADIDLLVEFTRNGRRNPAELARSNLVRVAYRLEDEKLIRLFWPRLDRVQGMEPYESVLLENVETVDFRYLDDKKSWHAQWPPLNASIAQGQSAPKLTAIEFKMKLKDWGELMRLIRVNV